MAEYRVAFVCLISALSLVGCANFDCPPLPPLARPAKNIYELRPQDIKVVMALGDSVTAGRHSTAASQLSMYYISINTSFSGFGMMGGHGDNGLRDLTEYRVKP